MGRFVMFLHVLSSMGCVSISFSCISAGEDSFLAPLETEVPPHSVRSPHDLSVSAPI